MSELLAAFAGALFATVFTAIYNRMEKAAEIDALVICLRTEMNQLWDSYKAQVTPLVPKLITKPWQIEATHNSFLIFNSNADKLYLMKDQELLRSFLRSYDAGITLLHYHDIANQALRDGDEKKAREVYHLLADDLPITEKKVADTNHRADIFLKRNWLIKLLP